MTKLKTSAIGVVLAVAVVAACGKKDETPLPTTPSNAPGSAWGQPGPGGSAPPSSPTPTLPPTQPTAAGSGQLAVPGPAALACSNDSMCFTHKCNVQYQKCAFPCQSDNDCIQGTYCAKVIVPSCWPKGQNQP
jgi:hypothetical protein